MIKLFIIVLGIVASIAIFTFVFFLWCAFHVGSEANYYDAMQRERQRYADYDEK
jgi:hypothetical protein